MLQKFKKSGLDTDKDPLRGSKLTLKNLVHKNRKSFFKGKLGENPKNSSKSWKTMKLLGLNSKNPNQPKGCLKENDVTLFEPKKLQISNL